jgi:hypothetical protein
LAGLHEAQHRAQRAAVGGPTGAASSTAFRKYKMNHLRDLQDTLNSSSFAAGDGSFFSLDEINKIGDAVEKDAEKAVCFWMGDISSLLPLSIIPDACKLPFPTCWFECEVNAPAAHGKPLIAGLLAQEDGGEFHATVFTKYSGDWAFVGAIRAPTLGDTIAQFIPAIKGDFESLQMTVSALKSFLSALHCSNVRQRENTPDAKLQKARAKRGKKPLFSYWTLELTNRQEGTGTVGGTHSSPRVHLRRGHPRQYAPGKWTWVQPCAVGNRANGLVNKDYRASPALLSAAL